MLDCLKRLTIGVTVLSPLLISSCRTSQTKEDTNLTAVIQKIEAELTKSTEERKDDSSREYQPRRIEYRTNLPGLVALPLDNAPRNPQLRDGSANYSRENFEPNRRERKELAQRARFEKDLLHNLNLNYDRSKTNDDYKKIFSVLGKPLREGLKEEFGETRKEVDELFRSIPLIGHFYMAVNYVIDDASDIMKEALGIVLKPARIRPFDDFDFKPSTNRVEGEFSWKLSNKFYLIIGGQRGINNEDKEKYRIRCGLQLRF